MCTNRRCSSSTNRSNLRLRFILKPRMILVIALILCWNLRNSATIAMYHPLNGNNGVDIPYHHHHSQRSHHPVSNVRMRAPSSLARLQDSMLPLGGAGITLSEETGLVSPVIRSALTASSDIQPSSTHVEVLSGPRRKKDCGEPSIATRGLLGPTLKRSFFAFTQDEVDQKVRDDEYREASERRKRDVQQQLLQKRTGAAATGGETQDTPLPWTCETKYEWKDMGADHYPRFVRTAECKSRLCFNGFFRCRPRRYKTKVLKRISPSDSTSCEDDDVSLPEALRTNWKFITVTINLCCDCTGRIPGNPEV